MRTQPSSPAVPDPHATAGLAGREALVSVGWRVEGDAAALRAVPYLVRGHLDWLHPDVRYAVPRTPTWHKP
jgi:hypothetical protein